LSAVEAAGARDMILLNNHKQEARLLLW